MMEIAFTSSFNRAFKKKTKNNREVENVFWEYVELFIENPFNRKLKTHKLSGKLQDLWSFSIEFDLRIIFYFTADSKKAVFIDIGKHDEVY